MSAVEDREVAELVFEKLEPAGIFVRVERGVLLVTGATEDPFLLSAVETLRDREKAVAAALALGPGFREQLAAEGRRRAAEKAEAKASGRPFVCKHKHLCDSPDTYIVERDGRRRCRRCMAARRAA